MKYMGQTARTFLGKALRLFSPTAESFGVSAQIGSGPRRPRGKVPPGFHQGSTRVPPGFHQGSTRVPPGVPPGVPPRFHEGSARAVGGASTRKSTACCWGISPELIYIVVSDPVFC